MVTEEGEPIPLWAAPSRAGGWSREGTSRCGATVRITPSTQKAEFKTHQGYIVRPYFRNERKKRRLKAGEKAKEQHGLCLKALVRLNKLLPELLP